jgi:hypothetical protein
MELPEGLLAIGLREKEQLQSGEILGATITQTLDKQQLLRDSNPQITRYLGLVAFSTCRTLKWR